MAASLGLTAEQLKERRREQQRVRRAANPQAHREHSRKWAQANPDKVKKNNDSVERLLAAALYLERSRGR